MITILIDHRDKEIVLSYTVGTDCKDNSEIDQNGLQVLTIPILDLVGYFEAGYIFWN